MLIPFIGYALGRRFIGYVESEGDRLADVLNRSDSIVIRESFVESFEEDTVVNLGDGEIDRSILYAIEAGGRGDGTRRIHTIRHRLQAQIGPYSALGLLDSAVGQLPLPHLHAKGPMIPLTDATIGYVCRGSFAMRDVGTLIVNRDLLDWVRANDDDAMAFPGVHVVSDRV